MKANRVFFLFKSLFSPSRSEAYILIRVSLSVFFAIFILNSIIAIYSIFGISSQLSEHLSGVSMARNAQVVLQEQIMAWQNILFTGNKFTEFQSNYHKFSKKSDEVQDFLFNLRLQYSEDNNISEQLLRLSLLHKEMTSILSRHISEMEESNFSNAYMKVILTKGMESNVLDALNDMVQKIEEFSQKNSRYLMMRYMLISFSISLFFLAFVIIYGKEIGRRLIKTNAILETLVQERTKEYVEANLSLQNEIKEHKLTQEKLLSSKLEVEEKNKLLSISERKYRHIVEGTSEIIFTLDENWFFKSANDAIKTELKINPDYLSSYCFVDLICDEITDTALMRKILIEKLEEAKREKKILKFNALLKTPNLIEPVEYKIKIEFIEIEGESEIIGKASKVSDSKFLDAFISEKCEYMIRNLLFEADSISHRITDNLQKYMDKSEVNLIRIGLREIIINSIEHGNLNITFEEKSEAIMNDRYFSFLNQRQNHPEYKDRRVRIEYLISPTKAVYKITDQGKGFNHKKYMNNELLKDNLAHGRGIAMVRNIFDEVRYNFRGNQVLLVKYLGDDDLKQVNDISDSIQEEQVNAEVS